METDAVLRASLAANVLIQAHDGTRMEAGPSSIGTGGDGTDVLHINLDSIAPAPGDGQAGVQARPSGTKRGGGAAEWTKGQTKLLLEYYYKYFPQIVPFKKFRNRK